MARNVFISFRYSDGYKYKEKLAGLFSEDEDTVDCSEDEDRSNMNDDTIRQFLYAKLRRSSVTIALITPKAIEYKLSMFGLYYDDWLYDEVRYSLEDRDGNPTNGLLAVYVPEAKQLLMTEIDHYCNICRKHTTVKSIVPYNNLIFNNMMNVRPEFKMNKCDGIYDGDWDSYCSLIAYDEFVNSIDKYIDIAYQKKKMLNKYNLCKRVQP